MVIEYVKDALENTGLTIYKNLPQLSDAVCHTLVINESTAALQHFNPDDFQTVLDSMPLGESESLAVPPEHGKPTTSQMEIVNVPNVKFINGFIGDWGGVEQAQKDLDEHSLSVGFYLSQSQLMAIEEVRSMLEPSDMATGFANYPLLCSSYYFYAPVALIPETSQSLKELEIEFVLAEVEILVDSFSVSFIDRDITDGWFKFTEPSLTA